MNKRQTRKHFSRQTDLWIARQFFTMLAAKGFGVNIIDASARTPRDPDFKDTYVSFELLDHSQHVFVSFDFQGYKFLRVSGRDVAGFYYDEVDWKKY